MDYRYQTFDSLLNTYRNEIGMKKLLVGTKMQQIISCWTKVIVAFFFVLFVALILAEIKVFFVVLSVIFFIASFVVMILIEERKRKSLGIRVPRNESISWGNDEFQGYWISKGADQLEKMGIIQNKASDIERIQVLIDISEEKLKSKEFKFIKLPQWFITLCISLCALFFADLFKVVKVENFDNFKAYYLIVGKVVAFICLALLVIDFLIKYSSKERIRNHKYRLFQKDLKDIQMNLSFRKVNKE